MLGFFYYFSHLPIHLITHSRVKYLSYIPSIEQYGVKEPLYVVSLKKINFFQDEQLDDFAQIEKFYPVIDKVIYIPPSFHEYAQKTESKNFKVISIT